MFIVDVESAGPVKLPSLYDMTLSRRSRPVGRSAAGIVAIREEPGASYHLPVPQLGPQDHCTRILKRSGSVALVHVTAMGPVAANVAPSGGAVITGFSGTLPTPKRHRADRDVQLQRVAGRPPTGKST